jgi:prepilin-type N-terminal cleavage/methylation domain-containing protein/prepilin-type processing-associated H-X9-DG protein
MARHPNKAFTLVELLVVIGIIALLISILLPALGRARTRAKSVQCMAQLRNLGQSLVMYAGENRGKLPQHPSNALWLWDIALPTRDALVKKGGTRNTLYCPFFAEQNVSDLWDGTFGGTSHDFAVIGYFWMGRRLSATDPSQSSPLLPDLIGRSYLQVFRVPTKPKLAPTLAPNSTAEIEVVMDSTIKQNGTWSAKGGWSDIHVTSHLRRGVPEGINILFLDGHVAFRPYKEKYGANDDVIRPRGKWGSPQIEFWF